MSRTHKGTKRHKCTKYVAIGGKVVHRFEDRGTSPHTGERWQKRVLAKAERRNAKALVRNEEA